MIPATPQAADATAARTPHVNRLPKLETPATDDSIAGRASQVRSEWTDIDYAVRRVDDPVEMIAQMLDRLPHC